MGFFLKENKLDEKGIIRGCLAGNKNSAELLYKKYSPVLYTICLRYAKNRYDADDILQNGFIEILLCLKNFKHKGSFEGWMKKIIVNTALKYNKENMKFYNHIELDNNFKFIDNEAEGYFDEIAITHEEIIGIIQKMPIGYRMVFNLYVFEEFSHKEIAAKLNISENTSKSQLRMARKYLKKIILKKKQINSNIYE